MPNRITAARLVLAIAVFVLIPLNLFWPALVVFLVAALTDWADGWWARRFGQVTKLGRILDPFVDKIIICGTFILLAVEMHAATWLPWYAAIAGWMATIVVARELLVTALRSMIEQSGGDFSARWSGKIKMLLQCAAATGALVALGWGPTLPASLVAVLAALVWLAVLSTVHSGAIYVAAAWHELRRP